jgi:hypothetical protein
VSDLVSERTNDGVSELQTELISIRSVNFGVMYRRSGCVAGNEILKLVLNYEVHMKEQRCADT